MSGAEGYIPQRGDIVWIDFNPQAGHEQAGRRPAIVLSPAAYNGKVGLALFCPITNQMKGYPFEVTLPEGIPTTSVVLADQIKSLDWRRRRAELLCVAPAEVVRDILEKVGLLLAVDAGD